ncbi:MAG TPA: TolC family protein [Oculatellaceae cyanobacterium]
MNEFFAWNPAHRQGLNLVSRKASLALLCGLALFQQVYLPVFAQPNGAQQTQSSQTADPVLPESANAPLPDLQATGQTDSATRLKNFKPLPVPPEPTRSHEQNKTLSMSPIKLGALIQIAAMRPLRLEASYDQPISLEAALNYAMENSLPIRIAHESVVFQEANFASQIADFLPNFSMNYTFTKSHNYPVTHSTSKVFVPRVSFPVFLGGNDFYSMLAQYYRMQGWKETYKSNVNDALLDVYQKYTNLVLAHSLLKIRVKAVQVSELQLRLNNEQYRAGSGTAFAIMQSRSQLATDKQALLAQQIATRQSALQLGYALNMPLSSNLVPDREYLSESALLNGKLSIEPLIDIALANRPELRQYELFRLAAARNVQVAASNLYPTATLSTTYNKSETSVEQTGAFQQAIINASSSSTSNTVEGAGIFGGIFNTVQNGIALGWSLPNLGMNSVASIVSSRALSRQASLQANQQLQLVMEQVRYDYISALAAKEQIDNAAYGAESSAEALRLAELRLQSGLGTNLELIQAQRDYINALYSQAQAIVASNVSQAQMLHDLGVISIDTLIHGYRE